MIVAIYWHKAPVQRERIDKAGRLLSPGTDLERDIRPIPWPARSNVAANPMR